MSEGSDATAASEGQEGRERNPWIKSRPRLDLQSMRHFPRSEPAQLGGAPGASRRTQTNRQMRRSFLT